MLLRHFTTVAQVLLIVPLARGHPAAALELQLCLEFSVGFPGFKQLLLEVLSGLIELCYLASKTDFCDSHGRDLFFGLDVLFGDFGELPFEFVQSGELVILHLIQVSRQL